MELEGKIVQIGDVIVKSEKYRYRNFAVEFADGKYNQYAAFQLSQDRCNLIDAFKVGSLVKVMFGIKGREWQGKYFSNMEAWRIELIQGLNQVEDYKPEEKDPFDFPKVENDLSKDPAKLKELDEQLPW